MTAEVSVEKLRFDNGESIIRMTSGTEVTGYYSTKEDGLKDLAGLQANSKVIVLLSAGFSVGYILASLAILVKDPNVGSLQLAGSLLSLWLGGVGAVVFVDARRKLKKVDRMVETLQDFDDNK